MKCRICSRDFPTHLIQELASSDENGHIQHRTMCPICALKQINSLSGLPEGTPFRGANANALHKEAIAHIAYAMLARTKK